MGPIFRPVYPRGGEPPEGGVRLNFTTDFTQENFLTDFTQEKFEHFELDPPPKGGGVLNIGPAPWLDFCVTYTFGA